ncbi:MAG TPA: YicC family protein [Parachlamydiaceae bacterium]|nr:YicC family protein [Parachlamydiaceae bacterium]
MTAYARSSLKKRVGRFSLEIQSVNRKFLEIHAVLPHELMRFDAFIKKKIGEHVGRGQINVRLFAEFEEEAPYVVKANLPLVRQIKDAFHAICDDLKISGELKADQLLFQKGVLKFEEEFPNEGDYLEAIEEVLTAALNQLTLMKEKEGSLLLKDIEERLQLLGKTIQKMELLSSDAEKKLHDRLIAKLNEVVPGFIENEERVLREVCLFAEKADITEEITRFKSHIEQFFALLKTANLVGKTLEFLIQEMNREVNTIGSKASDLNITKLVIEMKTELERIREQIQNVE